MSVLISKLAVQAAAQGPDGVDGCIFFKVTLPADLDRSAGGRFGLFPGPASLTSDPPKIYALPLPRAPHPASLLAPAASLLSLTPATAYPPTAGSSSTVSDSDYPKPYLEVSKSRQVYVCVDAASSSSKARALKRKDSFGGLSTDGTSVTPRRKQDSRNQPFKQEWLVCVPFLAPLLQGYAEGVCAISMHVPRCLNNTLRLRISYPTLSDTDEGFDVTTEPKTLMAPTNESSSPAPKSHHLTLRDPNEEGWEDGELPDATNRSLGLDGEEEDDGGESLQGRFPSTSILHIAWSPAISGQSPISHSRLDASTNLPPIALVELTAASVIKLQPISTTSPPSITFHQTIPIALSPSQQSRHDLLLRCTVPGGWAWSHLSVTGSGVGDARSLVTGDLIGGSSRLPEPLLSSSDDEVDDSFATVRGASASKRRQTQKRASLGPSLLRQSLPVDEVSIDDFSIEMPSLPPASMASSSRRLLQPADLILDQDLAVSIATTPERLVATLIIQGHLSPISHLHHTMPGSPMEIPSFKAMAVQGRQPCHIYLPAAAKRVVDLAQERLSQSFSWPGKAETVAELSDVSVSVKPTDVGTQLVTLTGRWRPNDSSYLELCVPVPGYLKLLAATIDGTPIRRGLSTQWQEWPGAPKTGLFTVVGLDAQGQFGLLRLLFETSDSGETVDGRKHVPLPIFRDHATRHVTVRIEDALAVDVDTNLMKSSIGQTYTGMTGGPSPSHLSYRTRPPQPHGTSQPATIQTAKSSKTFKLISFTSFASLIFLYILASVVIEVHHLRRELSMQNQHVEQYFAKQTRTLDGWETRLHEQFAPVVLSSVEADGSTAVGRPTDHTAFDKWLRHPAVSIAVSGVRRFLNVLRFLLTG